MSDDVIKSFIELGLSEQKAKETLKNANVTNILQKLVKEVHTPNLIFLTQHISIFNNYFTLIYL